MRSAEPVRVFCAANGAYAAPLCVMLASLVINLDKSREIEIHVLSFGIREEDRRKIEQSLRQNRRNFDLASLHWLTATPEMLRGIHIEGRDELEIYASRLLLPQLLPADCDKVLYLDTDMVILSDISPFYDLADGSAVHAVRDINVKHVSSPDGVPNYAELGIAPDAPYFNNGVVLINLRLWRERNIAEKILVYLKQHVSSLKYWDQSSMNAVLHDSWTEVDRAWNTIRSDNEFYFQTELHYPVFDWIAPKSGPHIAHYTGRDKPWTAERQPGYSYFFDYLDRTVYKTAFKRSKLEKLLGFKLSYSLWRLKTVLLWRRSPRDIFRVIRRLFSKNLC